jgi:hypothetical protein
MHTREELNNFKVVELRQIIKDNKINCVPTKMTKEDLVDTILSCQKGKLKCPSKPYVKLPDEFKGEVGCDVPQEIEINIKTKKKVVKDSSSPKKDVLDIVDIEQSVKDAILSYKGDVKQINTVKEMRSLLKSFGITEKIFTDNQTEILKFAKIYLKQKKAEEKLELKDIINFVKNAILSYKGDIKDINTVKSLKNLLKSMGVSESSFNANQDQILKTAKVYLRQRKENEKKIIEEEDEVEEEEDEEDEEEEEINEEDVEKMIKNIVLKFDGKPSEITLKYIKQKMRDAGMSEEQIKKLDNAILKKFVSKYGEQLKELRKKPKAKTPSPVKAKSPSPSPVKAKSPSPSPSPVKAKSPSPVKVKSPPKSPSAEEMVQKLKQKLSSLEKEDKEPVVEEVEEDEKYQEPSVEEEEESDVESLVDEEELLKERGQYEKFSQLSKALNECIMQTLIKV